MRWAVGAVLCGLVWLVLALAAPQGAPVGAVVQGVVLGSATALTSLGLILIWRANRFINFAQMALGTPKGVPNDLGEPTYGYTYRLQGAPFVEPGYVDKNAKSDIYPVTDEVQPVMAAATAGYLISAAVA